MQGEPGVGHGLTGPRVVTLPARAEPIRVNADETAIVVIDMQNAHMPFAQGQPALPSRDAMHSQR